MHTLHKFSDIDHLLILCNLSNSHIYSFINSQSHVYTGLERRWPMNDSKEKLAYFFIKKKQNVAVSLFQLFSLGFGDSFFLFSSSPKSTD